MAIVSNLDTILLTRHVTQVSHEFLFQAFQECGIGHRMFSQLMRCGIISKLIQKPKTTFQVFLMVALGFPQKSMTKLSIEVQRGEQLNIIITH